MNRDHIFRHILPIRRGLDEDFYFSEYPEVKDAGYSAVEHYQTYGKSEKKHPNLVAKYLKFESWIGLLVYEKHYFRAYPDVATSNLSARVHYVRYGRFEGRSPNSFAAFARVFSISFASKAFWFLVHLIFSLLSWTAYSLGGQLGAKYAKKFLNRRLESTYKRAAIDQLFQIVKSRLFKLNERETSTPLSLLANAFCILYRLCHLEKLLIFGLYQTVRVHEQDRDQTFTLLSPKQRFGFSDPDVFNVMRPSLDHEVDVPSKWIYEVKSATIIGAFQVLSGRNIIIYEPAADPNLGFVAGIWPFVSRVKSSEDAAVVWYEYSRQDVVSEAILLSGRCSPNYFHVLIEYFARAKIINSSPALKGTPVIVDAHMFAQEFEALNILFPQNPILKMERESILKVDRLYLVSQHTFHPDEPTIPFWMGGAICVDTLRYLRDTILTSLEYVEGESNELIYLTRRAGRNISNNNEIESLVRKNGFLVVDPSQLTFGAQIAIFRKARIIIGAMGAAFSNLIFCQKGTIVIALCSPFHSTYVLQANLAKFSGCHYGLIVGKHDRYDENIDQHLWTLGDVMDSYYIEPSDLSDAIDRALLKIA